MIFEDMEQMYQKLKYSFLHLFLGVDEDGNNGMPMSIMDLVNWMGLV